jgi:polyferredoxin
VTHSFAAAADHGGQRTPVPVQPYRRAVHALLFLVFTGLPFVRLRGESALRFDVPTLKLHLFGASLFINELFLVLAAVLGLTFLLLWVTVVYGRVWCGWLCPQTTLTDLTARHDRAGFPARPGPAAHLLTAAISLLVGAATVWYFMPPPVFFRGLVSGTLHPVAAGSWAVVSLLTWLNLLVVRERFCASVCPYAKLQGVLFDRHTLVIANDRGRAGECIECGACVKACPVGIDIRAGLQVACVSCAACIDACGRVLGRRGRPSLNGYFFGEPGGRGRLLRPASLALGAGAALFLALAFTLALRRGALDVTVLPNPSLPARLDREGRVVAAYFLALENREPRSLELSLAASHPAGPARVTPAAVEVAPGEHRRVAIYTVAPPGEGLELTLGGANGAAVRVHPPYAPPPAR